LIDIGKDGIRGGLFKNAGRSEVWKSLRKVDGAVLDRKARHFPDHRLCKL
jgi:hypothetical protein